MILITGIKWGRTKSLNIDKTMENSSIGFRGVAKFDSDQVPFLVCEEPANCWALPVVTLTSIALALPDIKTLLNQAKIWPILKGQQKLYGRELISITNGYIQIFIHCHFKGNAQRKHLKKMLKLRRTSFWNIRVNINGSSKENPLKYWLQIPCTE